ncbi:hypothetical protein FOCC_FOCC017661 [Frankliniella occidentalis]|nr:hypothetical protein FOCC_FOCC017661 [Frankliniella occidentalis]
MERSTDEAGETFTPWQYFAPTDEDCWSRYGVPATPGDPAKVTLDRDDEVICTSFHSKAYPAEDAAVHTWLVKGRPGANASSEPLRAFQAARRVRLRLEKLSQAGGALADPRRAFYSIKFLSIGAQCDCNGHASKCNGGAGKSGVQAQRASGCRCQHNTEGAACERCRPRFNQEPWQHGAPCVECQCHGHARACRYDPEVARAAASLDRHGAYRGGGVCLNCSDHTTGVNCERCAIGWFRPSGVAVDVAKPCVPCECHPEGSTGVCAPDDTNPVVEAGACECRDGYAGYHCDRCAPGFRNFPACEPCPCDLRGSEHAADCDGECFCKAHVEGARCDRCRPGYFGLDARDPNGCSACYCSGITTDCTEAVLSLAEVDQYQGWLVGDIRVTETVTPVVDQDTGLLTVADADLDVDSYYWVAPPSYRGNLLASYGSTMTFRTSWVVMRGDTSGKPTAGPDLILIGSNGMRIGHGDNVHVEHNATVVVPLREAHGGEVPGSSWYLLRDGVRDISTRLRRTGADQDQSPYRGEAATRNQLLSVLADVEHVLVRAKYHTDQVEGALETAVLQRGEQARTEDAGGALTLVEQCACPEGYVGLSCESCAWGHARVSAQGLASNATTGLASGHRGLCARCNCNGHAATCDPDSNACGVSSVLTFGCGPPGSSLSPELTPCEHNTAGERCERCAEGFFGDALRGLPGDCRPCACPLLLPSNNFSPTCELQTPDVTDNNDVVEDYVCTACPAGHAGKHCDRCAGGHYGDPTVPGERCRPCDCAGGPCDPLSGRCLSCPGNTDGWRCEKCKPGHYGEPEKGLCRPCECSATGSVAADACHPGSGQCECRPRFTGRTCDRCADGLGNVTAGCVACACDPRGSSAPACDPVTGQCPCRDGYAPPHCRGCLLHHYDNPDTGCEGESHTTEHCRRAVVATATRVEMKDQLDNINQSSSNETE